MVLPKPTWLVLSDKYEWNHERADPWYRCVIFLVLGGRRNTENLSETAQSNIPLTTRVKTISVQCMDLKPSK